MQTDIETKVKEAIERTPLEIKPRKSLHEQSLFAANVHAEHLYSSEKFPDSTPLNQPMMIKIDEPSELISFYEQNLQNQPLTLTNNDKDKLKLNLKTCLEPEKLNISRASGSSELEVSSADGLTPEDCNLELANVNYDIDFSDLSTENSAADELAIDKKKSPSITPDPFSPIGSYCNITQPPLIPCNYTDDAQNNKEFILPFVESNEPQSLLDDEMEQQKLQSPLTATSSYSGFSKQGVQIPTIPCSTGDYNSLNILQSDMPSTSSTNNFKSDEPITEKQTKQKTSKDEKIVNVLGGVLETFDKLF